MERIENVLAVQAFVCRFHPLPLHSCQTLNNAITLHVSVAM